VIIDLIASFEDKHFNAGKYFMLKTSTSDMRSGKHSADQCHRFVKTYRFKNT
jgi:hypothetical protein